MIASACIAMALMTPQENWTGASLLSKTIKTYHNNVRGEGVVSLTLKAGGYDVQIKTTYQFARPDKLYIRQQVVKKGGQISLLASSDKYFVYPRSKHATFHRNDYNIEAILTPSGRLMTVDDMYALGAAGLMDRSFVLDIIFSRQEDLVLLNQMIGNLKYEGKKELDGQTVHVVAGNYRFEPASLYMGTFRFYINGAFKIVKCVMQEENKAGNKLVDTTYVYDVSSAIDDEVTLNQSLFQIPKELMKKS